MGNTSSTMFILALIGVICFTLVVVTLWKHRIDWALFCSAGVAFAAHIMLGFYARDVLVASYRPEVSIGSTSDQTQTAPLTNWAVNLPGWVYDAGLTAGVFLAMMALCVMLLRHDKSLIDVMMRCIRVPQHTRSQLAASESRRGGGASI